MFYLDGELELMSPSDLHEQVKTNFGVLVAVYALEAGIEIGGYGSWTLKDPLKRAGAEPDECFKIGLDQSKPRPDLAVEVISPGDTVRELDDKVEEYLQAGVRLVWVINPDLQVVRVVVDEEEARGGHARPIERQRAPSGFPRGQPMNGAEAAQPPFGRTVGRPPSHQSNISTVRATSPAFMARKASLTSSSRPRRVIISSSFSRP